MPRLLKQVLLISAVILTVLGATFGVVARDASIWWAGINHFMPKLLGSKLECKSIDWCGNLKLCASKCTAQDNSKYLDKFNIDLANGQAVISDWSLSDLPKGPSQREHFPRVPLIIKSIILENGSIKKISSNIHDINYIELARLSNNQLKQKWQLTGILHKEDITLDGYIGDTSDFILKINKFDFIEALPDFTKHGCSKIKKVHLNVNKVHFTNEQLYKKPFFINLHDSRVSLQTTGQHTCYPEIIDIDNINISLDEDFKVNNILGLAFKFKSYSTNSWIGVKQSADQKKFILNKIPADYLLPFMPQVLQEKNIQIAKLNGSISAQLDNGLMLANPKGEINFSEIKPVIHIGEKKQKIIYNPNQDLDIKGKLLFDFDNFQSLNIKFNKFELKTIQNIIKQNDNVNLKIEGQSSGEINYFNSNKTFKGEINLKDLTLLDEKTKIKIQNGLGHIKLLNNNIKGKIKAFNELQNKVNADIDLNIIKQALDGKIRISSDKFTLKDLPVELKDNHKLLLNGDIEKFITVLEYSKSQLVNYFLDWNISSLDISQTLNSRNIQPFKLLSGAFHLDKANNLSLEKSIITLKDNSELRLDGLIKLPNKNSELNVKKLDLLLDGQSTELFSFIKQIANIKNYKITKGNVFIKAQVLDNNIESFQSDFSHVNLLKNQLLIQDLTGLIYQTKNKQIKVQDTNIIYDKNTEAKLNLLITPKSHNINKLFSRENIDTFEGSLTGKINIFKSLSLINKRLKNINLYIPKINEAESIPFGFKFKPTNNTTQRKNIEFDLYANLDDVNNNKLPASFKAVGQYNVTSNYFNIENLECLLNGLNLLGTAKGTVEDFAFDVATYPLIDLGKVFKDIKGKKVFGALYGKAKGQRINLLDKRSIWNNLELSLTTRDYHSVNITDLHLEKVNLQYIAQDGTGYAVITVDDGRYKNLPLEGLNSSLRLKNNKLYIDGLSLSMADGVFNLSGNIDLMDYKGYFEGNGENLSVGKVAYGISGERGFSGQGDFNFGINGRLMTLLDLKENSNVSASGSFSLRDGHVTKVMDIEKKLNLANLVFGGPFSLNLNTFLEVLAPQNNGYYDSLDGQLQVSNNKVIIPIGRYRGRNDLKLNMSGIWDRSINYAEFNVAGSIPKIPVRVNAQGKREDTFNVLTEFSLPKILGKLNILDRRPRVYAFELKGDPSNAKQMNDTAAQSFHWLDKSHAYDLPVPELPKMPKKK